MYKSKNDATNCREPEEEEEEDFSPATGPMSAKKISKKVPAPPGPKQSSDTPKMGEAGGGAGKFGGAVRSKSR